MATKEGTFSARYEISEDNKGFIYYASANGVEKAKPVNGYLVSEDLWGGFVNNLFSIGKQIKGVAHVEDINYQDHMIFLEPLVSTLQQNIRDGDKFDFLQQIQFGPVEYRYRFNNYSIHILLSILETLFKLHERNIYIRPHADHIAFSESGEVKITDLVNLSSNANLQTMLAAFDAGVVQKFWSIHKVKTYELHPYIVSFRACMKNPNISFDRIRSLPAFMGVCKRLDLALKAWVLLAEQKVDVQIVKYLGSYYRGWQKKAERYEHIKEILDYKIDNKTKQYDWGIKGVLNLVRNVKEHINEAVKKIRDRDPTTTPTSFPLSPINGKGNSDYTDAQKELLVELLFPDLIQQLIDYFPLGLHI